MSTRYKTYEMPYGWITIDTHTENTPEGFISGPYDVTIPEANDIEAGAQIELDETGESVTVIPEAGV